MANPKHPDVYVQEFATANRSLSAPSTTAAAFVGAHWRGPTTARLIHSWAEFVTYFGGFSNTALYYLSYAVYNFLANGGRECWVSRTTGTGIVTATTTLVDRAGTPLSTLVVNAKNGGAWGNNLRIDIVDRDVTNGYFDLVVKYGGTTDSFVVEKWLGVTMAKFDPRYVVNLVNNPDAGSTWISLTDSNSATAAPTNSPAVQAGTALTTGADGSAPSDAQKQASVTAGTSPLDAIPGVLTINLPGETTAANLSAADTYAAGRGNAFLLIDTPFGDTPAQAVTYEGTLPASSYSGVFYPWVRSSDPASSSPGATIWLPPGGFIAGKIAETDVLRGVFKAPAGTGVVLRNAIDLEGAYAPTDLDSLNEANVNVLRRIPGAGIAVMGSRTLRKTGSDKYIPVRRTLNYIKQTILDGTQWAVFEPNDHVLWTTISTNLGTFLTSLWRAGGLAGNTAAQAFYVKCDETNNTPTTILQGKVTIEVGVSPQIPAEFVVFLVGLSSAGSSVTEQAA